jgi:electron-transferring-flavoprotein dehydrogenase
VSELRPSDFPPPWSDDEAFAKPSDSDPIEVDVAIVGAGPAGLAAAIRLGQLGASEGRVVVLDKGRSPGAHLLSGAVVNPRSLETLLPGRLGEMPSYGRVERESVYLLTRRRALRIPPPPTMRNEGNIVVSLSELGRWLAGEAEAGGAMLLPETDAQQLLVEGETVVGIRTGAKGQARDGSPTARFEPGADVRARLTILAEGTQGHLTTAALSQLGLASAQPQVWALGVKEIWKVARPLDRVIHTMGWPLRSARRYREFGGSFIYPLGEGMVSIGLVVGLDYSDPHLSVHDLLQELKTHSRVRGILEGGERVQWGAKTIPEGGLVAVPQKLHAPGLLLCGDGAGLVNVAALKGIHYAIESGRLAAEAAWRQLTDGESLESYDASLRESFVWPDLREVRNMRQGFGRGFWVGSALAGVATLTKGKLPSGDAATERDAEQPLRANGAPAYPAPDGKLTFDKLSSVFLSGNRTREDQPNHIKVQTHVPSELAELWKNMCPAQVYEVGEATDGRVEVVVSPSNCVQCGAITAKGGRLTPPEGGSGPEYTLT